MNKWNLLTVALMLSAAALAQAADNMKAFPPADEGMTRHVLELHPQLDESAYKVEIIVGKTLNLDADNHYFFGGKIEAESIPGWGFTRYVVDDLGVMGGTLMAVDPRAPKVDRFVKLAGEPYLIRYNSKLPVVVYAPEDAEVRYRIWSAEPDEPIMEEG